MSVSLNKLARGQQTKVVLGVVAGIAVLIFLASLFMSNKHKKVEPNTIPDMTGVTSNEFNESASRSAFEKEEDQIATLKHTLETMNHRLASLQQSQNTNNTNSAKSQQVIQRLRDKIENLEAHTSKTMATRPYSARFSERQAAVARGITTTHFTYAQTQHSQERRPGNYIPPGTFVQAVALNGADTNAGANGQTDTLPITLRLLDNGVLPNGKHATLKGCFITAAAYGNASNERGEIRLQHLSCIRKNGRVLSVPVKGYVVDQGGSDGIRGQVVMRNGKLLMNAGFSGFLSGIGSAMQQSLTNQSFSPLGATMSVPSSKVLKYGAYGGVNTALGKLADYYIKLADLYHPIIQIHAGSRVDVVFLKGFSLDVNHPVIEEKVRPKVQAETQNFVPQQFMQQVEQAKLGQTIRRGGL